MAATAAVRKATRIQNSMTVQILEAQDVSNSQGNNDAKLRRFAATARDCQESGVHSYVVLNQKPKAQAALRTALKTFPADSENGKQLLALARDLSISAEGSGQ